MGPSRGRPGSKTKVSLSRVMKVGLLLSVLCTLYLVGYKLGRRLPAVKASLEDAADAAMRVVADDDAGGPPSAEEKAQRSLRGSTSGATGGPVVPSFYVPIELGSVEHGDPMVTMAKLDFDSYWRNPSVTPMFRDLVEMSKRKHKGGNRRATLNSYVAALPASGVKPVAPTGFVFHESRVGSTLVANMLASVPTNLVYSESQPPPIILNHCPRCTPERRVELLQKLFALMGASPGFHTRLFYKFQSITVPNIALLAEAFPDTPWIFVYREPVQVMMSHFKRGPSSSAPCLREHRRPRSATAQILGVNEAQATKVTTERYCAAHLTMLCESALTNNAASGDRALMVDYASLPGSLVAHVMPNHFKVQLDDADARLMLATSKQYSKARAPPKASGSWASDSKAKEDAASKAVKHAAAEIMQPRYEKLVEATKAMTGGDDLLHFKEYSI